MLAGRDLLYTDSGPIPTIRHQITTSGYSIMQSMAPDVTLKDGIETTLIEQIPEIRSVKDITDHSIDENAYYPQEQES